MKNKALASLGLTALIAGCDNQGNNIRITKNEPVRVYHIEDFSNSHIYACDLDSDRIIDEALVIRYNGGLDGFHGAVSILDVVPKRYWEHYVAEGMKNRAYIKTDYDQILSEDERDKMDDICHLLNGSKIVNVNQLLQEK